MQTCKALLVRNWRKIRFEKCNNKFVAYASKCKQQQAIESFIANSEENLIRSDDLGKFYIFVNKKLNGTKSYTNSKQY